MEASAGVVQASHMRQTVSVLAFSIVCGIINYGTITGGITVYTNIEISVPNSSLAVAKDKREFLTYASPGLAPCTLEEKEDSVNFVFDAMSLSQAETVLSKPVLEKYRFLYNCASLEPLVLEYEFPMSLDNLLIDINLMPKVMLRDAKATSGIFFIEQYMALVGSVLYPKYKHEDYLIGGDSKYSKHKILSELAELDNTRDIALRLLEEYDRLEEETASTKKLVSKQFALAGIVAVPALTALLVMVVLFASRLYFVEMPFRDSVIAANTAYINSDFLAVQRELREFDIVDLPVQARHILARAYVSTEALTAAQRANILVGLARLTDPIIFDYWILLGRLRFAEAVDIAQRLGDDELLLFAYLKQEAFVRQDMTISGAERMSLLSYLENNITRLNELREQAVAAEPGN